MMAAVSERTKSQGRGKSSSGSGSLEVVEKPRTTTVSVDDSETWVEAKRFTVYKVVVKLQGRAYFIFRRYNEFNELHDKLKKKFFEANALKLPGKRFLGNNFDPEFIRSRKERLHEFVLQMAMIPGVMDFPPVRDFLSTDNQRSTFEIYDNETIDEMADPGMDSSGSDENLMDLGGTEEETATIVDFDLLKVIGKGSFGKVYLSKHKSSGQCYAIKVLQKKAIIRRNEVKHIMAERNVLLKNVSHPFLVGLHYSFQTGKKLYFVLDYVNGGELFFHLQRERVFEEPRARFYAAEITSALAYLHGMDIVYRDLKPENILLDARGHIILTDFGLCKENVKIGETTTTFCGTPEYLAPEVLRKQDYGRAVDWWCLGVVTYEMMYSLPPFYSRDVAEMYDNILHKPLKLRPHISQNARNLLEGLLQKDKDIRLGSRKGDAQDIKAHPFFHNIDWDRLYRKEIEPPYNPNVAGDLDLQHFDPEFTKETVSDTPSPPRANEVCLSIADDTFAGFSYIPPTPDELV